MKNRAFFPWLALLLAGCGDVESATPDDAADVLVDVGVATDGAVPDAAPDAEPEAHDAAWDAEHEAPDARDAEPDAAVEPPCPHPDGWHVLPLRLHNAESEVPNLDFVEDEAWFQGMLDGANARWVQACIRFDLVSIEPHPVGEADEATYKAWDPKAGERGALARILTGIAEDIERAGDGWDVLLINRFGGGASGLYLGRAVQMLVFSERTPSREENHPNVLAHELGHSLTLPHYDGEGFETNVMRAGGQGLGGPATLLDLTPDPIDAARARAASGDSAGQ